MPRPATFATLLLTASALVLGSGCKKEPTCRPESVEWSVQLALGASQTINPSDEGEALPTSVRLIQLRGDLVTDDLDFRALWESEKASDLGESYLAYEELIVYPGQPHLRKLPLEEDATHIVAAGLFREPVGTTWYTVYEIPKRHPDVVCAKAPESKIYPDPCFFVYLDRATMAGGETPPPGLVPDTRLQCAELGVRIEEQDDKKGRRRRRRDKDVDLDDPLHSKDIEDAANKVPDPKVPDPKLPDPKVPEPKVPDPKLPSKPSAPKAPSKPDLPDVPRGR